MKGYLEQISITSDFALVRNSSYVLSNDNGIIPCSGSVCWRTLPLCPIFFGECRRIYHVYCIKIIRFYDVHVGLSSSRIG